MKKIFPLVSLFVLILAAQAVELYIDSTFTGGLNDGQQESPFLQISDALISVSSATGGPFAVQTVDLIISKEASNPYTFGTNTFSIGINNIFSMTGNVQATSPLNCAALPTIALSSTSFLAINLTSLSSPASMDSIFTISNIALQIDNLNSDLLTRFAINQAYSQVVFNSVCLTDYTTPQSLSVLQVLNIYDVPQVKFFDLVITTHGYIAFNLSQINVSLTIENTVVTMDQTNQPTENSILGLFSIAPLLGTQTSITILNSRVTCSANSNGAIQYLGSFLRVSSSEILNITSFLLTQCTASLVTDFIVGNADTSIVLSDFNVSDSQITPLQTIFSSSYLFNLQGSDTFDISDITVTNLVYDYTPLDYSGYPSDIFYFSTQSSNPSLKWSGLNITSTQVMQGFGCIFNFDISTRFNTLDISMISASHSTFDIASFLRIVLPAPDQTPSDLRWLHFENFTIFDVTFMYCYLLHIDETNPTDYYNLTEKEYVALKSWSLYNNTMGQNNKEQVECTIRNVGAFLYIQDLEVRGNNFDGCDFIVAKVDPSNFFLINAMITDNTQTWSDFYRDEILGVQTKSNSGDRRFVTADRYVKRLSRLALLVNVSSTNNLRHGFSELLQLSVPMFALVNSTIEGDIYPTSKDIWMELTGYLPFGFDQNYLGYVSDPDTENWLFSFYPLALGLINGRTPGTEGIPRSQVHWNVYENVSISACSLGYQVTFLGLTQLLAPSTGVHFYNVSVAGFQDYITTGQSQALSTVIDISSIPYVRFENCKFIGITGNGSFINVKTLVLDRTFIMRSTIVQSLELRPLIIFQNAQTNLVEITGNFLQDIYLYQTLLTFEITKLTGSLVLANNSFSNLTISSSPAIFAQVNLIHIKILQATANSSIEFKNSTFQTCQVVVDNDFVRNVFQNSFFFISTVKTPFSMTELTFNQISVLPQDSLMKLSTNSLSITNSVFKNVVTSASYGMMTLAFQDAYISGCDFVNVTGSANSFGSIFYLKNSINQGLTQLKIANSTFTNVISASASILFSEQSFMDFTMSNCSFTNVMVTSEAAIVFIGMQFQGFQMQTISVSFDTSWYSLSFPSEYTQGSSSTTPNLQGSFLLMSDSTGTSVALSNFSCNINANLTGGRLLSFSQNPSLIVSVSGLISRGLVGRRLTDWDSSQSIGFGLVYLADSTLSLSDLSVSNQNFLDVSVFQIDCLQTNSATKITLDSSKFSQLTFKVNASSVASVVDILETNYFCGHNVQLLNSEFELIASSSNGSVIANLQKSDLPTISQDTLSINNCTFNNNSALAGGVIFLSAKDNTKSVMNILNSDFIFNSAMTDGGAIWFDMADFSLSNCLFMKNQASMSGGAIYTNTLISAQILSSQNNFVSNAVLKRYGSDFASDPQNLVINFNPIDLVSQVVTLDTTQIPIMLRNISSLGLQAVRINITVSDKFNETVIDDTVPKIITFKVVSSKQSRTYTYYNCSNQGCLITPSDLQLTGNANETINITVSYTSPLASKSLFFQATLRGCVLGEVNASDTALCTPCPGGKYSSHPSEEICKNCLDGADCPGGSVVNVQTGYWRPNTSADYILPCSNPALCLGGTSGNNCTTGYSGPLCQQCDSNGDFARVTSSKCSKCEDSILKNIGAMVGKSILSTVYLTVFILINISSNKAFHKILILKGERVTKPGFFVTLMTSYIQMLSIVFAFDDVLEQNLDFIGSTANPVGLAFFSSDCALLLAGFDTFKTLQLRIVISTISPVGYWLFSFIIILICRKFMKKTLGEIKKKTLLLICFNCMFILMQPGLIKDVLGFFNCNVLDTKSSDIFMYLNKNIQCNTDSYRDYRNQVMVPLLLLWGLLIPAGILGTLYRHRKSLSDEIVRLTFGGFVNEYLDHSYYWGIILVILKEVLLVVASVLSEDPFSALLVLILIYSAYSYILTIKKPHVNTELYRTDKRIIVSLALTSLIILLQKTTDNTTVQRIALVPLLLVNLLAGLQILKNIVQLSISQNAALIIKLKRKLAKCFGMKGPMDDNKSLSLSEIPSVPIKKTFRDSSTDDLMKALAATSSQIPDSPTKLN